MKYHYKEEGFDDPMYGEYIMLDHPAYTFGTLFCDKRTNRGIAVVEQHFDPETKHCFWGAVGHALANDIYLSPNFKKFFEEHAREAPFPIYKVRSLMWQLRMKPLKREPWEVYFS